MAQALRSSHLVREAFPESCSQDDFGGPDGMPESVLRLGNGPLSALAALVLHLQRLHCVDELAGHAALVSPYEVGRHYHG